MLSPIGRKLPRGRERREETLSIGEEGELSIQRGFLKLQDDTKPTRSTAKAKSEGPAAIPESLVAELTAYQTAALRNAFAQHSAAALRAVVHALAEQAFFHGVGQSCLRITLREVYLPLALSHAASTCRQSRVEFADYVREFRSKIQSTAWRTI
ncbi:hypothetical protein ML401_37010 (plasmid) [Bradyrhizobium sp. 62B]|uniref:hypothetical protein n=1 Tax=Bradyrhizobium sp. 62B TaxID=2898442 RepID=UPI0025583597|nr:hypothetical protein ML401_37010 [Bradyrhizobium sp. 62B]